jgi:signal transduction histidine kinase
MAAIVATVVAKARRADADPQTISESQIDKRLQQMMIGAALCSTCWALGLLQWTPKSQPELALIAVAVSMTYAVHAAAAYAFIPRAVMAFSTPLVLGSVVVLVLDLHAPVAKAGIVLIALQAFAAYRLLRSNWSSFARSIDLDVERGRLAAMLHEQKEIAEKAVQLKTRFLASASHDLRQPMHAISLYLDGLAEVDVPERIRGVISDARVCAHDMNDMFRSLLDVSRLDAHQAVPTMSAFAIGSVLSRVEKEFGPLAASRGVRLKVRPCTEHAYSDPVMVERIVLNFVSNAVRHTPNGRVLVGCRVRGRALRVAVYDTGRGNHEAEQQAIFDELVRQAAP